MELVGKASERMTEEHFSLLIVDCATNLYRTDYQGLGELAARQQHMRRFFHKLQQIADKFKVVVVVTNYVVANPDNRLLSPMTKNKPSGGNVIGSESQTRLKIRKGRGVHRICDVYASSVLPPAECAIIIENGGITDA